MLKTNSEIELVLRPIDIEFLTEILGSKVDEIMKLPISIDEEQNDSWKGASSGAEH